MATATVRNKTIAQEGRDAFAAGLSEDDCPYKKGDPMTNSYNTGRYDWFSGYFDARTEAKFPHIFKG